MLSFLYENIGIKIKTLAAVSFIVEAVTAVIAGIVMIFDYALLAGLLTLLFGPVIAFVASWLLYGFGELIDKLERIEKHTKGLVTKFNSNIEDSKKPMKPIEKLSGEIECPVCGQKMPKGRGKCESCGQIFNSNPPKAPFNPEKDVIKGTHTWRCDKCNTLITKYPCAFCGYDPEKAKNIPLKVSVNSNGNIVCPVCNKEQNKENLKCESCEQIFINGQPDIPFWCKKCGRPGPYDNYCPNCGSSIKISNAKSY